MCLAVCYFISRDFLFITVEIGLGCILIFNSYFYMKSFLKAMENKEKVKSHD